MNIRELTKIENESIGGFLSAHSKYFRGAVYDVGCGRQPYRHLVEAAGAQYFPYDRVSFPANMSGQDIGAWPVMADTLLSTQVIQFTEDPQAHVEHLYAALPQRGHLLISGPTNWPCVNEGDHWRFTLDGAISLLRWVGFEIVVAQERAGIDFEDFSLPLGWGIVARA